MTTPIEVQDAFEEDLLCKDAVFNPNINFLFPVVFYNFHEGDNNSLTPTHYTQAIQGLNSRFASSNIQFYLANVDRQGCSRPGYLDIRVSDASGLTEIDRSRLTRKTPDYFPYDQNIIIHIFKDIDYPNAPINAHGPEKINAIYYSVARMNGSHDVLAHEMGHYLGLYHVWGPGGLGEIGCDGCLNDECKFQGDRVCDTNPTSKDVSDGCSTITPCYTRKGPGECNENGEFDDYDTLQEPTQNFMGYKYSCSPLHFTEGQKARMQCLILGYKDAMINPVTPPTCSSNHPSINQDVNIFDDDVIWNKANLNEDNSNTVFSSCDIIVNSGGKLTIDRLINLKMCENTSIVVEPGGQLIIEGKVTSVDGSKWQGIIVKGQESANHNGNFGFDQGSGVVRVLGGEISNAITGIQLHGNILGHNSSVPHSGGRLDAQSATFKNNDTAIKIADFVGNYDCFIKESDFLNTSNNDFESFIDLTDVMGISIVSTDFVNMVSGSGNSDVYGYGYGIWAKDAGFSITTELGKFGMPDRSYFSGLDYGVYISSSLNAIEYQCTVKGAVFLNCYYGIYNNSSSKDIYTFNQFNLGSVPNPSASGFSEQYGILLNGEQSDFTIEQNEFSGNDGSNFSEVGLYCGGIGTTNNFISKNSFDNLSRGIVTNRRNGIVSDQDVSSGLILNCNTFDQAAVNNDILAGQGQSLNPHQKMPVDGQAKISVANHFSRKSSAFDEEDFISGSAVTYYFNNMDIKEDPISHGVVEESFGVDPNGDCSDLNSEFPGGPATTPFSTIKTELDIVKTAYDNVCTYHLPYPHDPFTQSTIPVSLEDWVEYTHYKIDSLIKVASWTVLDNESEIINSQYEYLLSIRNSYSNDIKKVKYHTYLNEWAKAYELAGTLPSKWSLTGDALTRHNLLVELVGYLETSTTSALDSITISRIDDIATLYNDQAGFYARAFLNKLGIKSMPYHDIPSINRPRSTEVDDDRSMVHLYPNPVSETLTIHLLSKSEGTYTVSIFDIHGKIVKSFTFKNQKEIDVSELRGGVYFYSVQHKDTILKNGKIIKL